MFQSIAPKNAFVMQKAINTQNIPIHSHISWMHSGEMLNKLSAQFIEYAALWANSKNVTFLELKLCSNACII